MTLFRILLLGLCLVGTAYAQTSAVYVFLDRSEPGAGCTVALGSPATTVAEIDTQLRAVLDSATGEVVSVGIRSCSGSTLGAENTVMPAGYGIGRAFGVANGDVVEISVSDELLRGDGGAGTAIVSAAAVSGASVDLAVGEALAIGPATVPALPVWGSLLLVVVLARLAFGGLRRRRGLLAVGLVTASACAWAAGMVLDGLVDDWGGIAPRLDPEGDATIGGPASDITAVFATRTGSGLFFRVDVLGSGPSGVNANDDFEATDEDTPVAFGVLENDENLAGGPLALGAVDTAGLPGVLINNGDGSFSYDPRGEFDNLPAGATATVTFRYTAAGGVSTSTTVAAGDSRQAR